MKERSPQGGAPKALTTRETLLRLVQALVDEPGAVSIRELRAAEYVILELYVSPVDRGLIIGTDGRMLRSLRIIGSRLATMRDEKVRLELALG